MRALCCCGISESVLGELLVDLLEIVAVSCLGSSVDLLLLKLVEPGCLNLSLLLKSLDESLLGPADLLGELSQDAELAVRLQSQHLEGVGDDQSALLIIGIRNALENLQLAKSSSTLGSLVWEHASDNSPEDARWSSEVELTASGVRVHTKSEEFLELELVSEERTRSLKKLTSDDYNSLTVQELLSNL